MHGIRPIVKEGLRVRTVHPNWGVAEFEVSE